MSSIVEAKPDESQHDFQRGTITLIRALVNRIEVLAPDGNFPSARSAIEGLLKTAKERHCRSVYAEIEGALLMIVRDLEGTSFGNVPVELAAARTRMRALLDRIESLSSSACAPGSREAVEVVADNEDVCIRLGKALIMIVQELEEEPSSAKKR